MADFLQDLIGIQESWFQASHRHLLAVTFVSRSCDPQEVRDECSKPEVVSPYEGSVFPAFYMLGSGLQGRELCVTVDFWWALRCFPCCG